jgi:hypothetical protein
MNIPPAIVETDAVPRAMSTTPRANDRTLVLKQALTNMMGLRRRVRLVLQIGGIIRRNHFH